jgi:hypothetical protein
VVDAVNPRSVNLYSTRGEELDKSITAIEEDSKVDKDAKIPEDDWKKKWKAGNLSLLAPEYKPGTHEVERGDVTWHQLRATGNAEDVGKESPGRSTRRRKIARNKET